MCVYVCVCACSLLDYLCGACNKKQSAARGKWFRLKMMTGIELSGEWHSDRQLLTTLFILTVSHTSLSHIQCSPLGRQPQNVCEVRWWITLDMKPPSVDYTMSRYKNFRNDMRLWIKWIVFLEATLHHCVPRRSGDLSSLLKSACLHTHNEDADIQILTFSK